MLITGNITLGRGGDARMYELKNARLASLFLFLAAFLWSIGGLIIKSVAWNGLCLATLRGVIAFAVSAYLIRGQRFHLNRTKLLSAFCYFAQGVLLIYALKYTTAANATVLQNTSPLYIILLNAWLAKRRPTNIECVTCASLFAGVALAFMGNLSGGGTLGNSFALVSAFFYAGVYYLCKEEGAEPIESLFLGNAFYLLFIPFFLANEAVRYTSPADWALLILFASLNGIGAWLCFTVGIRHTSALHANFITMTEPVMAPLWTFLFLHEHITALSVAGCTVVFVTLLAYHVSMSRDNVNVHVE